MIRFRVKSKKIKQTISKIDPGTRFISVSSRDPCRTKMVYFWKISWQLTDGSSDCNYVYSAVTENLLISLTIEV